MVNKDFLISDEHQLTNACGNISVAMVELGEAAPVLQQFWSLLTWGCYAAGHLLSTLLGSGSLYQPHSHSVTPLSKGSLVVEMEQGGWVCAQTDL